MCYHENMKFLKNLFKRNTDITTLRENVSDEVISNAYKTREKEIKSLRKYDRGEKKITPSNLREVARSC